MYGGFKIWCSMLFYLSSVLILHKTYCMQASQTSILGCADQHFVVHFTFAINITHWNSHTFPPYYSLLKTPAKNKNLCFHLIGNILEKLHLRCGVKKDDKFAQNYLLQTNGTMAQPICLQTWTDYSNIKNAYNCQ